MSLFASNLTADIYIGKTWDFGGEAGRYVSNKWTQANYRHTYKCIQTTQKIIYMSFYSWRMMSKCTMKHVQTST